jgi:hypothetical protein
MGASGGKTQTKLSTETDRKIHSIDISPDQFPIIHSVFVRCTYPSGGARRKLIDPGSCMIPSGYTIQLSEWRRQQGCNL